MLKGIFTKKSKVWEEDFAEEGKIRLVILQPHDCLNADDPINQLDFKISMDFTGRRPVIYNYAFLGGKSDPSWAKEAMLRPGSITTGMVEQVRHVYDLQHDDDGNRYIDYANMHKYNEWDFDEEDFSDPAILYDILNADLT